MLRITRENELRRGCCQEYEDPFEDRFPSGNVAMSSDMLAALWVMSNSHYRDAHYTRVSRRSSVTPNQRLFLFTDLQLWVFVKFASHSPDGVVFPY